MYSTRIDINSFEELRTYFNPEEKSMTHCAVRRGVLRYTHHYIVLGHTWNSEEGSAEILHYSSPEGGSAGMVMKVIYSKEKFRRDITTGLAILKNDEYPANEKGYEEAYARFEKRQGE